MTRGLAVAFMLVAALLGAGPASAQTEEEQGFLSDLVIDTPIAVNTDEDSDGIRLGIVSWGDFETETSFTIEITEQPEFVTQATIAEGNSIAFKPDEFEQLITVMLSLAGDGAGDLVLEVRPQAADIQPEVRRIVLPLTRGLVEAALPLGDPNFRVCLSDADLEVPPPAECDNNVPLFPLDKVWIMWDTPFDQKHSFQWRLIGPIPKHIFTRGRSEYETNSLENDVRVVLASPERGNIRIQARATAQRAGEYTLQYRDAVKEVIGSLFGVGDASVVYEGEWKDVGVFTVAPAVVTFKGFVLPSVVSFKSGEETGGNIRPDNGYFGEPDFSFEAVAEWDYKACKDQLFRQESTARVTLSFPAELDLGLSLIPDAISGGGVLRSEAHTGVNRLSSEYHRGKSPDSTFVPLTANLETLSQGFAQFGMCDDWGRVSFSLRFGDLYFTSRSLGSVNADTPLKADRDNSKLLYKKPNPQKLSRYDYDPQEGHNVVKGPIQNARMGVRALVPRKPVGDPVQRLGDHLRDPGMQFVIPVDLLMTSWEGTKNPDYINFGKPLTGYAVYGSVPGPYQGARPLGGEASLSGTTADSGQPPNIPADESIGDEQSSDSGGNSNDPGGVTAGGAVTGTVAGTTGTGGAGTGSSSDTTGVQDSVSGSDATTSDEATGPGANESTQGTTDAGPVTADASEGSAVQSSVPDEAEVTPAQATPPMVVVAEVVGRPGATARTALENQGLEVTLAIGPPASTAVQNDTVMSARPAGGTRVASGETVELVIYSPAVINLVVPDLVGTPAAMARTQLVNDGFEVVAALGAPAADKATADTVQSLRPAPGTRVEPGTSITMVIHGAPAGTAGGAASDTVVVASGSGGSSGTGVPAGTNEEIIAENKPGYYVARIWGSGYRTTYGGPAHIYGEQITVIVPRKGKTLADRVNDWQVYMRGKTNPCKPGLAPLCPCAPSPYMWQEGPYVEIIGGPFKGFSEAWNPHKCDRQDVNVSLACSRWTSESDGKVALGRFKDFRRSLGCPIK